MATIQDAIKRLIYQFSSTGADKVAADLNKVSDGQSAVVATSQKTEQASLSLDKSFASLERRFDSTIRAQQDYQKVQDKVNAAVAQNPELQERANNVLSKAGEYFDKAKGSADGFTKVIDAARGAALGLAAGIGPLGALLGSFGPWGIAAAAGIGLVVNAWNYLKEAAANFGDQASKLKEFSQITGLTTSQVRGLSEAGQELGVGAENISKGIEKFTVNLLAARQGSGDLYDQLKVIDGQLAEDISNTHDAATALDLLTKAYNSTADATTKAALAKAAFGRGGASVGPVLGVIGDAGGVEAYARATEKALGVTGEMTDRVASLSRQLKDLQDDYKTIEASAFSEALLSRQVQAQKTMNDYARAVRDAAKAAQEYDATGGAGASADQILAREQAIAAAKGLTGATKDLTGANAASTGATNTDTTATKENAAAKLFAQDAAIKLANSTRENVAILGSAATAYEKLQARLAAIELWYVKNAESADIYNRAVAAAYQDSADAEEAQKKALDAVNDSHGQIVQSATQAKEAEERAYQAALDWQQAMLGVSAAADAAAASIDAAALAEYNAQEAASSGSSFNSDGSFQGGTGSTGAGAYTDIKNAPYDYGSGLNNIQVVFPPVKDLTTSVDDLKNSTDALTATNRDLLSPLYNQDPRTSHIGFRSQGMADGGYVDVPGGISANDNMVATIPVASGERIYVDAMPGVRGKGGGGSTFNISIPVTINGNATRDETSRTMYQVGQTVRKQLAAVG